MLLSFWFAYVVVFVVRPTSYTRIIRFTITSSLSPFNICVRDVAAKILVTRKLLLTPHWRCYLLKTSNAVLQKERKSKAKWKRNKKLSQQIRDWHVRELISLFRVSSSSGPKAIIINVRFCESFNLWGNV